MGRAVGKSNGQACGSRLGAVNERDEAGPFSFSLRSKIPVETRTD